MTITRNNYEEFFLLYVDNELSASAKKAVEAFVRENSDLEEELTRLMQSTFKPESSIIFDDKHSLMKHGEPASFINPNNSEEYFLLYIDNELDKDTRTAVELFVSQHPEQQQAFNLLMQTRLESDLTETFAGKHELFKKVDTEKKILFPWFRLAAAAAILLFTVAVFIFTNKPRNNGPEQIAGKDNSGKHQKNSPSVNVTEIKKETPVVTSVIPDPLDNKENSTAKMTMKGNKKGKNPGPVNNTTDVQNPVVADNKNSVLLVNTDRVKITEIARLDVERTKSDPGSILIAAADPLDRTVRSADIASAKEQANYGKMALEENNEANTNEEVYLGNTTPNKNKLRGIFRKVSRVFDKNANADDDNKRGVLIGGFQIALK